jgi:hypothetical protein
LKQESREFVRHTVDVPLEVSTVTDEPAATLQGVNVSHGGLAFLYPECPREGQVFQLRIPTVTPPFEAQAKVVWCRRESDQWLVGVSFMDSTHAFQSRMVQQACAIESYRKEILANEGRSLSTQEAAAEWIGKFAGRFPGATTD